jgi:hypothetical protein
LPLCFSSFKTLKKNVYNVLNHKPSRQDVGYLGCSGMTNENHLPLCFHSFELLKENHEIKKEEGKSDCNSTALHEQIVVSEEYQQPSHAFNDHVANYMEGYVSSDLYPVLNYQLENQDEADQEIVIKGHFPSLELNIDILKDF